MKNRILILVAILVLGVASVSSAFFGAADPITTEGAANVKVPVYNNSGSALDEGDVVVWDVDASTGNNDLYVTTTTTADTGLVAGVVDSGGMAIGATGGIIVYGLAQCDADAGGVADSGLLCTSATAGAGGACASDESAYAIATESIVSTQGNCFIIK